MQSSNVDLSSGKLFDVTGLTAVVTGGGTGIGLMITRALVANGIKKVYIVGRRLDVLQTTAQEYGPDQIVPLQADLTEKDEVEKLKMEIQSKENYLDLLVNNSGISGPPFNGKATDIDSIAESLWSAKLEDAKELLHTNILGYFFTTAALLPLLGQSPNHPQVINISSNASFGRRVMAGMLYSMTKASVTHFTKLLATHLAPTKVRCNAIAPGLFPSELTAGNSDDKNLSELKDTMGIEVPLGRAGNDKEMASAVLFLASKNQLYTSGSIIQTDGGVLNIMPSSY
ncbi:hypothetical protein CROQUDRAFT_653562 [Cronartium quercuum f. sp. fusiforme G11]|uniref:Uncharacterized protein n=1 Tax=Cronartium quercuum f. sp. fusiforme G11 TaxID=708437 RepID=A0A9P6TF29_9BASI|nr:hypothetical protein CROQUDRAFT_653562 [Cronartium quercuum f. sp. fusiforme G11]